MTTTIEMPVWALLLLIVFAAITFASHFLFPSVRWFFRRRMERVVARLNKRLARPIEPFKLARRYDMIQRLIYDREVSQAIADHAKSEGIPENVAFEQARRYAREIVPGFSATAYFGIAIRLSRWLCRSLYKIRLGYFDEDALNAIDQDATVVFVMNHRSNMDYVLVTWLVAERSALSYAVGEWAQVWPLNKLIRAMGAYFIRRNSSNDLYRKVLARYVRLATDGGVEQAVFPEGGLSLDGALAPPKLGLLKYVIEGREEGARDVVFVPVAINYDRVFEDRILVAAGQAGERRFGARISVITLFIVKQFWLRITGKYHLHGCAAVNFGEPVSLNQFTLEAPSTSVRALGRLLIKRIGQSIPVLPAPLVARALTEAEAPMTRTNLEEAVGRMIDALPDTHANLPRDDKAHATEAGLRHFYRRNLIAEVDGTIGIVEAERPIMAYYANSIAHLFRNRSE